MDVGDDVLRAEHRPTMMEVRLSWGSTTWYFGTSLSVHDLLECEAAMRLSGVFVEGRGEVVYISGIGEIDRGRLRQLLAEVCVDISPPSWTEYPNS
jgi:hypothetical protein